jgi:hypothetical protein
MKSEPLLITLPVQFFFGTRFDAPSHAEIHKKNTKILAEALDHLLKGSPDEAVQKAYTNAHSGSFVRVWATIDSEGNVELAQPHATEGAEE